MNTEESKTPFKKSEFPEGDDLPPVNGSQGMELPDYVDEDAYPPSTGKWYANPGNWKYIALGLVMLCSCSRYPPCIGC